MLKETFTTAASARPMGWPNQNGVDDITIFQQTKRGQDIFSKTQNFQSLFRVFFHTEMISESVLLDPKQYEYTSSLCPDFCQKNL